jgi:hypothetical protein
MDFITYLLSFINHNGIWIGCTLIVLASLLLAPVLLIYGLGIGLLEFISGFTVGMIILFMGLGQSGNRLINKYGEKGTAMIVSVNATNMYTGTAGFYSQVYRYKLLLRTAKNKTVETSFKSTKVPIVVYTKKSIPASIDLSGFKTLPPVNVEFPVKYIKRHPRMFVIPIEVSNQQIQELTCTPLRNKLLEAKTKLNFDPTNLTYKKNVADLMEEYFLINGCEIISDSTNINLVKEEIMKLRRSQ